MTSLIPKPPYTDEELAKLYPKNLELQLVQVLLRHGERTPVSARFENAGLFPHWPYCHAAERFRTAVLVPGATEDWSSVQWKRRLEKFGADDRPVATVGPASETTGICQSGELTDKGRQTTHALGARLRKLYVDRLHFMPERLDSSNGIHLRSTPIPRALESLQQAFIGMYPASTLGTNFAPPTIVSRSYQDEILHPNDGACRRFGQLAKAFNQRAANRWNDSPEIEYLNKKIGKWMPESSPRVAVDSHPRLSGILDTTSSTLAHGPATRLPKEFYEDKVRSIEDQIVVDEWFSGYRENREYRKLGIGALAGDIVERLTTAVDSRISTRNDTSESQNDIIKFSMSGCHDTTLAALMTSFGGFQNESWPPYTSHIAIELFKRKPQDVIEASSTILQSSRTPTDPRLSPTLTASTSTTSTKPGWFASIFGPVFGSTKPSPNEFNAGNIGRKPFTQLTTSQQQRLQDYYVRVRYNDTPTVLPACRQPGNHLEGDETLCTLKAFKRVVDSITPKNWKVECQSGLGRPIVGINVDGIQPAGQIEEGY